MFLGDVTEQVYAKTAFGLRDWAVDLCIGEWRMTEATVSVGLPQMSPARAKTAGVRAMIIGVANIGGQIPPNWMPALIEALESGLDLVAGMHHRLCDVPLLRTLAKRHGRQLIDVRQPPVSLPIASGRKRKGKRLLTVGTDCALGKKYTALSLARKFKKRDIDCDFRATGQTGILIAGRGIAIDAVVADFAAGAAELISPSNSPNHWDIIEGQGSLFHPAYAGVSLALLHGSQPDVVVVCHDPRRRSIVGYPQHAIPSLEETIALNLALGARTNPAIICGGVSLNTSGLDEKIAQRLLAKESERLGLPVADPMREGEALDTLVDACLATSIKKRRKS